MFEAIILFHLHINSYLVEWLYDCRFCYMEPFNGTCQMAEEKVEGGLITISSKRLGYDCDEKHVQFGKIDISARLPGLSSFLYSV